MMELQWNRKYDNFFNIRNSILMSRTNLSQKENRSDHSKHKQKQQNLSMTIDGDKVQNTTKSANTHPRNDTPDRNKPVLNNQIQIEDKRDVLNVLKKFFTNDQIRTHEQSLSQDIDNTISIEESQKTNPFCQEIQTKFEQPLRKCYQIQFERVEIQPTMQEIGNVGYEIGKINEQILTLEGLVNIQPLTTTSAEQLVSALSHHFNKILMTNNFLLSKIFHNLHQSQSQLQVSESMCLQLRSQLHSIHLRNSQLMHELKTTTSKQCQLYEQLFKIRSVMECYQKENFEMRDEIDLLQKVIDEMNVQVEKAERKLDDKRRDYRILEEQMRKMRIYVVELETEVSHESGLEDQVASLKQMVAFQEEQIIKWKARCLDDVEKND